LAEAQAPESGDRGPARTIAGTPAQDPAAPGPRDGPTARQNLVFFILTLAVFLATRLIGLERFPIYFFCDEAVQTVQATRFVANGFRDELGQLFPTYFRNGDSFNLSIGVYLQILPQMVFGHSVFVARATQVLVLFTAMAAVGLMLRDFFRLRFWWVGVLVLSAMPGWFLHTRIAFELMLATSCYVWFLYFYLRYRHGKTRSVFPALLFGALTFYGYNTFQPVVVVTALLLAAVDAPYHWKHWKTVIWAIPFLFVLVLPYLRFLHVHPVEIHERLRWLYSYWADPALSVSQKLQAYGSKYIHSFLSPYWFRVDNDGEIPRHLVKGRAQLSTLVLPFAVVGFLLCALKARQPAQRTLLVALIAAPVGTALVALGITRAMTFVVVVAMLAAVAADALLRIASRLAPPVLLATVVFLSLAGGQGYLLADALRNGPTWFTDYGLYGMQWGASQVFEPVKQYARHYPDAAILISPVWTNGADDILNFFLPGSTHVRVCCNIDALRYRRMDIPDQTLLVMTEAEYQTLAGDRRFADVRLEKTLNYPDGSPGFRFVWLRYAPDFEEQQAAVRESWHKLRQEEMQLDGETVRVGHSAFDIGGIQGLFDGDPATLVRTENANPAVIVVQFPHPRPIRGIRLTTASMDFELGVSTTGPTGSKEWNRVYRDLAWNPTVELTWPVESVDQIRLEIRRMDVEEPDHVHVRDLKFL
jgi:hypothetical protein